MRIGKIPTRVIDGTKGDEGNHIQCDVRIIEFYGWVVVIVLISKLKLKDYLK